jgi:hypothetical protein
MIKNLSFPGRSGQETRAGAVLAAESYRKPSGLSLSCSKAQDDSAQSEMQHSQADSSTHTHTRPRGIVIPISQTKADRQAEAPAPGRILQFVERHEVTVQLIPFFIAVGLMLLSFFSQNVAEGMQLLSLGGPHI